MTFPEFEKYQEEKFEKLRQIGKTKGKEYANSTERFANFKRLAEELDLKCYQIGYVFFAKHKDAISSYCKHGEVFSEESIQGRIDDAILYLLLIGGMIEEERKEIEKIAVVEPPRKHQPFEYDPKDSMIHHPKCDSVNFIYGKCNCTTIGGLG